MIRIYNSLTRRKEALEPVRAGRIGMYVCGDTVYDLCHMGHARSKIAFDVIRRHLMWSGYAVDFVRNITDIDDKIIRRAGERGEDIGSFTERYIALMHRDYDALGILRPDHEPRATQYVPDMIALAQRLIANGHAYVAADGDVVYSVRSFPPYGALSGERLEDLVAGERVAVDSAKRDPLDFVLWKMAKPGEPAWPSPWGPGRPGWHIECSAMSEQLLGTRFDIHGGGNDLKFPHHENEIAQSCAASGDGFAKVWMHNGFLTVDDAKMSKSLGNAFTIEEALKRVKHPEVIRCFVIASHYRGPVNYAAEQLVRATAALNRIYTALRDVTPAAGVHPGEHTRRFREAMDDDFNTPEGLAVLQTLTRELNVAKSAGRGDEAAALAAELLDLGRQVLGILQVAPQEWAKLHDPLAAGAEPADAAGGVEGTAAARDALSEAQIEALIVERQAARQRRDFRESDRIRDQLAAQGVVLEDRPGGTTQWRRGC
ncbi:MAG TPA: cysteine--tRNA ligase [Steroidobacteraceae bacterium]|nr:cysteine--tRNA ligase [Steroidobacteraceae bacterium]